MDAKKFCEALLQKAGVKINGNNPWDVRVFNEDVFPRVMRNGSLGAGESYMDHAWDCPRLDEFFYKIFRADLLNEVYKHPRVALRILAYQALAKLGNWGKFEKAFEVGEQHYDLSNEFYEIMLDSTMSYSCGYFQDAHSLEEAQEDKLRLVCEKLHLEPGMKILDIGCGWGGFAKFAAENYGVSVVGLTISRKQAEYARNWCQNLPVNIMTYDYRDPALSCYYKHFDRVASIGMFEHVGYKNYSVFMEAVYRFLKDKDSLFLLHTIGGNADRAATDPWMNKYIFPNGMLPSSRQITEAAQPYLILEDWHNFGPDYDKTLMAWWRNFKECWPMIETIDPDFFNDRFYRMWKFYLLACAGLFRARKAQLWQLVFSKNRLERYRSVR